MAKINRVVLAFSGGLDTSAIIPWLKDTYGCEVIAYCSDLGNAPDEAELQRKSDELGAERFIFEDVKDEFTAEYFFPALLAEAKYENDYLLGTSLARPLIAKRMAEQAKIYNADAIAHGATGKGNDQLRFERAWAYLCPDVEVIAPWKIWDYTGRDDLRAYLATKNFHTDKKDDIYSEDVNLVHRSCEGGILEEPEYEYKWNEVLKWVDFNPPADIEARVKIGFNEGIPTHLNGEKTAPAALLSNLNELAGKFGIGVEDIVEDRIFGTKSRGIYETPGANLLYFAIRKLKQVAWSKELMYSAQSLSMDFSKLIYDGVWFSDSANAIRAFFTQAGKALTGEVELLLKPNKIHLVKRDTAYSLYEKDYISFETDQMGQNRLADGYCKLAKLDQITQGRRDLRTKN